MFVTKHTEFKCPYCNYEYKRIVGSGTSYEYKGKIYEHEWCLNCEKEFLYAGDEYMIMPENKNEVKFHSRWVS